MLKIYNTLSRKIEEFVPQQPLEVKLYTCGPTVYDYMHIGNWRSFVFYDLLRRTLEIDGFKVRHIMNVTDVGHLTGDNIGHADLGEDRLEKGAKREGKSVWDIAQAYLDDFLNTRSLLNILPPVRLVRATDYVPQQIDLIKQLFDKGLAYETHTGVFFEVEKFPNYGVLAGQKLIDKRIASREEVEEDKTKRNPADFALWLKTVDKWQDHTMRWSSPWGEGFPGWHLECSAIALGELGDTLDIHTGGIDHIAVHHTNEIAQAEGATGKQFVKYWLHGEFLTVDGGRMGKSLGNAYTLHDIAAKGFEPLALRYLYLTAHYRDKLNFTWESLGSAQNALNNLREEIRAWPAVEEPEKGLMEQSDEAGVQYWQKFRESANNDLNTPQALAVMWDMVRSDTPTASKSATLLKMDQVLGLGLGEYIGKPIEVPVEVQKIVEQREKVRVTKDFQKSDELREEIKKLGYDVLDTPQGQKIKKR